MPHFQSLVTFWNAPLIKANIVTSLRDSALEWYNSEISDFDRNTLNNNPRVKSLIKHFPIISKYLQAWLLVSSLMRLTPLTIPIPGVLLCNMFMLLCNRVEDTISSMLSISFLLPTKDYSQNSKSLYHPEQSWQRQLISFMYLKNNKRSGMRWWQPHPDSHGITT